MERKRQRLSVRRAGMAAVLLGALATAANAQTSSLAGSVVDRYGVVVARAPVEARNTATGTVYRTFASDQANYELRQLPAGTYVVSVSLIGFRQYRRENVALAPGQALRLDIRMEDGETLNTPGSSIFDARWERPQTGPRRARPSERQTSPVSGFPRRIRIPSRRQSFPPQKRRGNSGSPLE